ncbi:MAG: 2-C-methyl-D-erythritol 4-phosphate cytidylyltransferase [Actinomycetales bacterium]
MAVSHRTAALVPAAGRGERLGPGLPKALRPISGTPMLAMAVHALAASRVVDLIVVAAPAEFVDQVTAMLVPLEDSAEITVVEGGATRSESVARTLIGLPDDVGYVLVHDAARPLVPAEVVIGVVTALREGQRAVIPGIPLVDTVKAVDSGDDVVSTIPRDSVRAVQTPQGFARSVLAAAHAAFDGDESTVTDDASLVERLGVPVHVVPGHEDAFKVTRPIDLVLAEALVAKRRASGILG